MSDDMLDNDLLELSNGQRATPYSPQSDDEDEDEDEEGIDESYSSDEDILGRAVAATQLQREMMAADNFQVEKRKKERQQVLKHIKNREQTTSNRNQRKMKGKEDQDNAMSEMAAIRARKNDMQSEMRDDSDDMSDGEDEREELIEEQWELDYKELQKIQVTRKELENFHKKPIIDDRLPGFFIRVGMVRDGNEVFRASQITNYKNGMRSYKFCGKTINKAIVGKYGAIDRDYPLNCISNAPISEDEFVRWRRTTEKAKGNIPSKAFIEKKLLHKKELETFRLTSKQIAERIEENQRKGIYADPCTRRMEIHRELRMKNDPDVEQKLRDELDVVEKIIFKEQNALIYSKAAVQITAINQRNRESDMRAKRRKAEKNEEEVDTNMVDIVEEGDGVTKDGLASEITIETEHKFTFKLDPAHPDALPSCLKIERPVICVTNTPRDKIITLAEYQRRR